MFINRTKLFFSTFFAFVVIFKLSLAQYSKKVEGLNLDFKNAKQDTTRAVLYIQLSQAFFYSNPDTVISLCNKALTIVEKNYVKSNSAEKRVYANVKASAYQDIGALHKMKGDFFLALDYYNKALKISKEWGRLNQQASILTSISSVYSERGDYGKGLDFLYNSLKIRETIKDSSGVANCLNNLGLIYADQKEFDRALDCYTKSLALTQQIGEKRGTAITLNNIAGVYKDKGDLNTAREFINRSLKLLEELNDKAGMAGTYNKVGYLYKMEGNLQMAKEFMNKGLKIRQDIGDKRGESNSLTNVGSIYLLSGDIQKAREYGLSALKLSKELGLPETIKNAAELLRNVYLQQKNYEKAYEMFTLSITMRDSINNQDTRKSTFKKQLEYKYEQKATSDSIRNEGEKKIMKANVLLQDAQIKSDQIKKYALYSGLILVLGFAWFMFKRVKITNRQKEIIKVQKEIVEEKQRDIVDSINYAKRIQYALLANENLIKENLTDYFIYFKPKDIVSGDFYWSAQNNDCFYLACSDSTGHGVPGAFMSLLNIGFLSEAINEKGIREPNKIFDYVRQRLISSISAEGQKDGFDGILICKDQKNKKITYAAANNAPILIKGREIIELKKNRMPVGEGQLKNDFDLFTIDYDSNDILYLYTDGYADQFGGPYGKKFKYKQLEELLQKNVKLPMTQQRDLLEKKLDVWRNELEQVDDILVIGIRL